MCHATVALARALPLASAPWRYLAWVELARFLGEGSVSVACNSKNFSCVLLCSVAGEELCYVPAAAVFQQWVRPCHRKGAGSHNLALSACVHSGFLGSA